MVCEVGLALRVLLIDSMTCRNGLKNSVPARGVSLLRTGRSRSNRPVPVRSRTQAAKVVAVPDHNLSDPPCGQIVIGIADPEQGLAFVCFAPVRANPTGEPVQRAQPVRPQPPLLHRSPKSSTPTMRRTRRGSITTVTRRSPDSSHSYGVPRYLCASRSMSRSASPLDEAGDATMDLDAIKGVAVVRKRHPQIMAQIVLLDPAHRGIEPGVVPVQTDPHGTHMRRPISGQVVATNQTTAAVSRSRTFSVSSRIPCPLHRLSPGQSPKLLTVIQSGKVRPGQPLLKVGPPAHEPVNHRRAHAVPILIVSGCGRPEAWPG